MPRPGRRHKSSEGAAPMPSLHFSIAYFKKEILMTRYNVTAWCSFPHYTTFEVEASSLLQALSKAREQASDECAEPCNGAAIEWDEFQIHSNNNASKPRTYFEPSRRVEMAALHLLRAAEFTLSLLEVMASSSENRQERILQAPQRHHEGQGRCGMSANTILYGEGAVFGSPLYRYLGKPLLCAALNQVGDCHV